MTDAKQLRLIRVETPEQRKLFTSIVKEYHSYVPQPIAVGRQINYLIQNGEVVGCIGVAQCPNFPSNAIMDYFRLPHNNSYKPIWLELLPTIGNNWRFTLKPNAPPNTASRILGVLVRIAPRDWKAKYGIELKWMMTFVHENKGKTGGIYKAAGWKMIGYSAGVIMEKRGYSQFKGIKAHQDDTEKKAIWMKALKPEFEMGKVVGADSSPTPVAERTQAAVAQQESTDLPGQGRACDSTPAAPLTVEKSKYHMEKKNGRFVVVRD